jgi:hypothetical protein
MDQMREALLKALGPEKIQQAQAAAAKEAPTNCEVCGDVLTDEHDGTKCQEMAKEAQ